MPLLGPERPVDAPAPLRSRGPRPSPAPPAVRERLGRLAARAAPPLRRLVVRVGNTLAGGLRVGIGAFCFYAVFFNLSVVRGSSMAPGIEDGDRILVEPWSYLFGGAERGDVVVLRYPLDPGVDYIKRVIGLPGDRVTLADGRVWVNGRLLDEPYVDAADPTSYLSVRVEDGHYFVLGDNRPRSSDSREFGQVHEELVRGRVDLRLWPLERVGWIH